MAGAASTTTATAEGTTTTPKAAAPASKQRMNLFDLANVGLSSTLAIAIFIGIGYVVRHVAGPSAIVSVLIAACIAYLVGAFYTELNTTILSSAIKSHEQLSQVTVTSSQPPLSSQQQQLQVAKTNKNRTKSARRAHIPKNFLLSSSHIAYICNGEFGAFIVAWNLIMEYIVIVALISKALIVYLDAAIYGDVGHLTQLVPMSWPLSEYFDVLALVVPILVGVPLMVLLGRNTILNVISIVLSLFVMVIFLFIGIFNANISNWNLKNAQPDAKSFFAFGADGVLYGIILILFIFIAFDMMMMSPSVNFIGLSKRSSSKPQHQKIQYFGQTVERTIFLINTILCLCLVGMALALTIVQPIHLMDKSIPLLSVIDVAFTENDSIRTTVRLFTLIAGCFALIGSLYAVLHAEQRVIQTMLSTDVSDSTFKLFGKFGLKHLQQELRQQYDESTVHGNRNNDIINNNNNINSSSTSTGNRIDSNQQSMRTQQRQWHTYACLLFTILSCLLAGLFAIEHLINLLSIGTLVMLFTLTIDTMILRHSAQLKQRLHSPLLVNGKLSIIERSKSMRMKISLITILLVVYCLLAIILTIYVRLVITDTITVSTIAFWTVNGILAIGLLAIVFLLGMEPKGNAMFAWSFSHPLPPAIVLVVCIYLCTAIDVAAWIRFAVWMVIGIIFYMLSLTWTRKPTKLPIANETNGRIVHEIDTTTQTQSSHYEQMVSESEQTRKSEAEAESSSSNHVAIKISEENFQEKSIDSREPIDEVPSSDEMQSINLQSEDTNTTASNDSKTEEIEMKVFEQTTPPQDKSKTMAVAEYKPPPQQRGYNLDHSKLNEISSVEDVRHTIIERREPNGTTYFVEVDKNDVTELYATVVKKSVNLNGGNDDTATTTTTITAVASSNSINELEPSYELSESEKIELEKNMMERVLNQTDIEPPQPAIVSVIANTSAAAAVAVVIIPTVDYASDDSSDIEDGREVRAIVHASNSRFNSPMYTPPPTPATPPSSLKHKSHPLEKQPQQQHSQPQQTPNFRIGTYESQPSHKLLYENDQSRRAFKSRLEHLFSQSDDTRLVKSQNLSPVSRYAQRLLPFNAKLSHSMSAPESLVDSSVNELDELEQQPESLPAPSAPLIVVHKANGMNGESPSQIPSPPAFNQQLYDTIGRRNRKAFASTGDVIDIEDSNRTTKSAPNTLQKSSLLRATAHENLTRLNSRADVSGKNTDDDADDDSSSSSSEDEIPNIAAIRQKLEDIFSKGRTVQADVTDLELNQNENVRRSKRRELFDTVRMQKMRFSSVLKSIESIGPDVHPNLHPTHNLAAEDIQQEIKRRESMSDVHSTVTAAAAMEEQPTIKKSEDEKSELNAIVDEATTPPIPTKTIE